MKLFLLLYVSFLGLSAQTQPHVGMKAGVVVSNVKAQYTGSYVDYAHEAKVGVLFGVLVHWPLSESLYFRPGLELIVKGSKERHRGSYFVDGGDYDFTIGQPLTYIDVPLNLLYAIKSGKGKILIGG